MKTINWGASGLSALLGTVAALKALALERTGQVAEALAQAEGRAARAHVIT